MDVRGLIGRALELGADAAVVAPVTAIQVEDHFPRFCAPPGCPNFGMSAHCPPHVMSPADFRERLKEYGRFLAFRFDVPMEIMLAEERHDVNRLLQETAASLEREAAAGGCGAAWAIAADCCKRLFCQEHTGCSVLAGGACRNPDKARTSMSGLGVNFNVLARRLGWSAESDGGGEYLGMMVGVVLLDAALPDQIDKAISGC
ncbi:MAG: DUF2284 domain-containing protein [Candidatus Geothermincolia bacterium]